MLQQGHDTVGESLAWTWYLLSLHPEVERKLHRRSSQVVGDRLPVVADLAAIAVRATWSCRSRCGSIRRSGSSRATRSTTMRLAASDSCRVDNPAQPLPHPSASRLLGKPGSVRSRSVPAGAIEGPAAACLFPLRRRTAPVHGRRHGHDGDAAHHRHGGADAPDSSGVVPSRGARVHPRHDSAQSRAGHAAPASRRCRSRLTLPRRPGLCARP